MAKVLFIHLHSHGRSGYLPRVIIIEKWSAKFWSGVQLSTPSIESVMERQNSWGKRRMLHLIPKERRSNQEDPTPARKQET